MRWRDAAATLAGRPQVPVDLVIDHSLQVDRAGTAQAHRA